MKKQILLVAILALSTTTVLPMEENNNNNNNINNNELKIIDDQKQDQSIEQQEKQKEENKSPEGSFFRRFLEFGTNAVNSSLVKNKENNKEDKKEKEEADTGGHEDDYVEEVVVPVPCTFYVSINRDGSTTLYKNENPLSKICDIIEIKKDRNNRNKISYLGMNGFGNEVLVEEDIFERLLEIEKKLGKTKKELQDYKNSYAKHVNSQLQSLFEAIKKADNANKTQK